MLAIQTPKKKETPTPKCRPNILPCRINYNGFVNAGKRYWDPVPSSHDTKRKTSTAHFRGRKLLSTSIAVPDGYKGVVLQSTNRILTCPKHPSYHSPAYEPSHQDQDIELDEEEETKILEEKAHFDEIIVWGHESLPNDGKGEEGGGCYEEVFRGVGEWVGWCGVIHNVPGDIAKVGGDGEEGR